MGRAVLTRGDFATVDELPAKRQKAPLAYGPSPKLAAPPWVPSGLLRASTVRAFNEVWFRKAPRQHTGYESIPYFFHPLDGVLEWNRIYGRAGFIQYQFAVPLDADATVREALGRLAAARCPSFLTVLKRFGPGNPGPLSFPMPGWTLTVDVPADLPGLGPLLDGLDETVVAAGGRVYLSKDSRLRPDLLAAMYPRLREWRAERERPRSRRRPVQRSFAKVGTHMNDALGGIQTALVLGGTSELALATLAALDLRPGDEGGAGRA